MDARLRVIDSVEFVEKFILPKLTIKKARSIAVHPTCSTTALGISNSLNAISQAISDEIFVPESWGCCAFAGDRGFTFPELTESATEKQAAEIKVRNDDFHVSANRTCEIGMTQATGKKYRHIIEVLEELSRTY
jgi:D-lactate dehydrogenase